MTSRLTQSLTGVFVFRLLKSLSKHRLEGIRECATACVECVANYCDSLSADGKLTLYVLSPKRLILMMKNEHVSDTR